MTTNEIILNIALSLASTAIAGTATLTYRFLRNASAIINSALERLSSVERRLRRTERAIAKLERFGETRETFDPTQG